MKRFRKILVGIAVTADGGEVARGSVTAVQQARSLAERTGAKVTLLHSSDTDRDMVELEGRSEQSSELAAAARQRLAELRDALTQDGLDVDLVFTSNKPWVDIIRAVLQHHAELVVVGKRDAEGEDGRHTGSVATKLLRKCPAPVWVVHPDQDLIYRRIVAATDLSAVGDLATQLATYLAAAYESELHIVHAYTLQLQIQMELASLSGDEYAARLRDLEREIKQRIHRGLGEYDCEGSHLHVGCTTPWRAISEALEHLQPELLVMGTLSRGGIAGLLVGNTAERILGRVDCSLLTIKPEDFVSPVTL